MPLRIRRLYDVMLEHFIDVPLDFLSGLRRSSIELFSDWLGSREGLNFVFVQTSMILFDSHQIERQWLYGFGLVDRM